MAESIIASGASSEPTSTLSESAESITCYERDEGRCEDGMCLRTGCRLRNDRPASESAGASEGFLHLDRMPDVSNDLQREICEAYRRACIEIGQKVPDVLGWPLAVVAQVAIQSRAAPVQAEPVAWRPAIIRLLWEKQFEGSPWGSKFHLIRPDSLEADYGALADKIIAASPPTPVSGEADWKAIAKELSDTLLSLRPLGGSELLTRHGKGDSETYLADAKHFRLVIANTRNELHELKCDAVRQSRSASATPVSAGLDDMGKQNGSEEIPTRKRKS